MGMYLR